MFRIKKGSQEVITISDTGDITFSGFYQENAPRFSRTGELQIAKSSTPKLATVQTGGGREIQLEKRLFETALLTGQGLQFKHPSLGVQAELHPDGDLYLKGKVINALANPALPGSFAFSQAVYAAPGLIYSGNPALAQYVVFQTPTPGYQTRKIDISDFANLPASPAWPFNAANVPINGLLRIPQGAGPFPLCLIVHGNHSPQENSTPGYIYLLELLASHGIIAGSVDCNFLNGFNMGENDGRAIVHLEHIKQFQIWNQQSGHPLFGKVDFSSVMIAGHSRGGEAVGHASYFNTLDAVVPDPGDPAVPLNGSRGLGPYHFNLKAVVAIAPTENQYQPVSGRVIIRDNYIILHGSRDGDVSDFQGYQTYDRAHSIDLSNPTQEAKGFKALLWIYGANHNFFNSVWKPDGNPFLSRPEQENVAKVYLSAIAQGTLLRRSQYLNLLKDYQLSQQKGWIANTIRLVSQYQDQQRLFIAHYEEDNALTTPSPPVAGSVDTSNIAALELSFNQGSSSNLYQQTKGLKVDWDVSGKRYVINLNPGGLPTGKLHLLAFRSGQSNDSKNLIDKFQNFTILLSDGTHFHSVKAASIAPLPYPADINFPSGTRRSVMQTLRLPLHLFAEQGVDVRNIRQITFLFDEPIVGTSTCRGSLYFDEIQLSH
ncbi:MAG: hypothetical protein HY785_28425 [Oscillatoriophycideae cyanobacterium NC_groundwater_1537_Pr4_S-0.65um_50_18]|nr:hypothetical protein [Oscillatoriophycideae cyanobacterium NC_groundwater_1537_Pr4_S-0.65um_50_18]